METKAALDMLGALAHEGRLHLFRLLVQAGPKGLPAGEAAARAGLAFTTASAQLGVLAQAGLTTTRREGRSVIHAPDFEKAAGLLGFLLHDCCGGRTEVVAPMAKLARSLENCAPDCVGPGRAKHIPAQDILDIANTKEGQGR